MASPEKLLCDEASSSDMMEKLNAGGHTFGFEGEMGDKPEKGGVICVALQGAKPIPEATQARSPALTVSPPRGLRWSEEEETGQHVRASLRDDKSFGCQSEVSHMPGGTLGSPLTPIGSKEKACSLTSLELQGKSGVGEEQLAEKRWNKDLLQGHSEKRLPLRENFNLYQYNNMHMDLLGPLNCKLIKHYNEPHLCRGQTNSFHCNQCQRYFYSLRKLHRHWCQRGLQKAYRCPLCKREFYYRVSINSHMQTHSLEKPLRCVECNKGFSCSMRLRIHQHSHYAVKPFECARCGAVFRHRSVMEDHRQRHSSQPLSRCNLCGKSFRHGRLLAQHHFLHTGHKRYRCSDCGRTFALMQNLRSHQRQHHRQSYDSPNCPLNYDKGTPAPPTISESGKVPIGAHRSTFSHFCPCCPLAFPDPRSLQLHMGSHTSADAPSQQDRKPFKCNQCCKAFEQSSVLERHMRSHERAERPFQCKVCGKSFRFSSYLQQHLIIHTGQKPFKCPECGKDFAFLQNMRTHQRLHQQKPYRCTQCRKGYSEEAQLQYHMLSHSGQKPHKCHFCQKSFALAYLLRDHLNSHTGERPHRCGECHKTFPWLSSLLVHQKIHARKRQGMEVSAALSPRALGHGQRSRRHAWHRPLQSQDFPLLPSYTQQWVSGLLETVQVRYEATTSDRRNVLCSLLSVAVPEENPSSNQDHGDQESDLKLQCHSPERNEQQTGEFSKPACPQGQQPSEGPAAGPDKLSCPRLLQCMICGCSVPCELDLHEHYMQHAQGHI